jgi:small subunit ribosomal protein S8
MSMTDPIADMLTRIRNAVSIYQKRTSVPYSKLKEGILKVLKEEGFIADYRLGDAEGVKRSIFIYFKYGEGGEQAINRIERVSKSSRRVYRPVEDLRRHPVMDGMGIAVVSTSKGVLSDRECVKQNLGGEVLCSVW